DLHSIPSPIRIGITVTKFPRQLLHVGCPHRQFEHHGQTIEIPSDSLRIRALVVVLKEVHSARRTDRLRTILSGKPPGDVNLMYPVINDIAAGIVPTIMPSTVEPILVKWPLE